MSNPCNKCQCVIKWDETLNPPTNSPRAKEGKKGWWREDLSKEVHTATRCEKFQGTGEFEGQVQVDEIGNVKQTPLEPPPKVTTPTSLKPREMDAADFAEPAMKAEVLVHCKFIKIIEDVVLDFLGKDANPNHVGMYVKLIQDLMERKN